MQGLLGWESTKEIVSSHMGKTMCFDKQACQKKKALPSVGNQELK